MTNTDIILTGLRSNGEFHLGNYLGAIKPMVELQQRYNDDQHQLNMFVPDLHSFTTPVDHRQLYEQTLTNLAIYHASGLDFNQSNTYIYRQSHVPAHSELCVILNNFAYFGELSRMVEFKEKTDSTENVSVGLFDYPALMAADIILHGARWVPVGEDQRQHIELARDLAIRVNNKFESEFPDGVFRVVPAPVKQQNEFIERDEGLRIRSLRNPENKMSKSVEDPAGTIRLSDDPAEAAKKIMGATTDSVGVINYDLDTQPGITNLLIIESQLSGRDQGDVNSDWVGKSSYGDLKKQVAATVEQFLTELQSKIDGINRRLVIGKLETDEDIMRERTSATLRRVQQAVGVREL